MKSKTFGKDKEIVANWVYFIKRFNLYDAVGQWLPKFFHILMMSSKTDQLSHLLGPKADIPASVDRDTIVKTVVDEVLKMVNLNSDFKLVDKALNALDVPLDDYPNLKMQKIRNSVNYYYSCTM